MNNTSYDPNSRGLYWVRFVYDFTYFLAGVLIFLNMISGLIIDAFAELRNQKTITEEKKRNICYVCSINRNIVDLRCNAAGKRCRRVRDPYHSVTFPVGLPLLHIPSENETED